MATTIENAASKGVANTALGLGIAGTALALGGGAMGMFGRRHGRYEDDEFKCLRDKEQDDNVENIKSMYEAKIAALNENFATRQTDMKEKFDLYQYSNNHYGELEAQIKALKSEIESIKSVAPYEKQLIENAIQLEAERRQCADNKIVNYVNSTFNPQYIADMTPSTTSTKEKTYNPLGCNCNCNI